MRNAQSVAAGRMECLPSGQRGQRPQAVPIVGSKADHPDRVFTQFGQEGEPMVKRSRNGKLRHRRSSSEAALAPASSPAQRAAVALAVQHHPYHHHLPDRPGSRLTMHAIAPYWFAILPRPLLHPTSSGQ